MPILVCPTCKVEMKPIKHEGIEIDVCTNCQGIWLDKGELDKLTEKAKRHYLGKELKGKPKERREFWVNLFDIFKE